MAARAIRQVGRAAALAVALLLASCAPKKPPPPAPPAPPAPSVKPVALDPQSYMALSASNALFAVRASGLAEERGSTAKLKKFATTVVREQTGIGAQLSFAGRRIDLLPSSRLLPEHQVMLERLATATDFDATYKAQLAKVLTEAAAAHRAFEENGDSPTLRPVARFAASVCEQNLETLRSVQ